MIVNMFLCQPAVCLCITGNKNGRKDRPFRYAFFFIVLLTMTFRRWQVSCGNSITNFIA